MDLKKIATLASTMRPGKCFLYLLLFSCVVFLSALGGREIASGDETRVAGIAAEMVLDREYAIPRLNGEPFLEYPPLYYWATAFCFHLFGFTDFAAQLPSAGSAIAGVMLLFVFAVFLKFNVLAAAFSCVMLATGAQYFSNGRTCMVDSMLAMFILLAVAGFYRLVESRGWRDRCLFLLAAASGMAGGVMTKGLLGLVLPLTVCGSYLLITDIWLERRIHWRWYFYLAGAALLALIPVAFWLFFLYRSGGGEALHTVVWVNNFGRFLGSQGDHVEPFYYYLLKLPGLFQPYLIFLFGALFFSWKRLVQDRDRRLLFLLIFLLAPFLLLTAASAKRQVYLLPLYAPAALLAGDFFYRLLSGGYAWADTALCRKVLGVLAVILTVLLGIGGVVLAILGHFYVGGVLAVGGAVAVCMKIRRGAWTAIFPALGIAVAGVYSSLDPVIGRFRNEDDSLRLLFAACREAERAGDDLYLYEPAERVEGAALFYLGRNVPQLTDASVWPEDSSLVLLIRNRSDLTGISASFPLECRKFADKYYFVRGSAPVVGQLVKKMKEQKE